MKFMKKTKLTLAGLILATGLGLGSLRAQTSGSFEYIKSLDKADHYFRPTVTFTLPVDVKGMSFGEFYKDGTVYTKTTLSKPVTKNFGAMEQTITFSGAETKFGLGAYAILPMPKNMFAKTYIVPTWITDKGQKVNSTIAGYFVSAKLPLDITLSSFGEVDLSAEGGPKWSYGEIGIEKKITDNLSVSYQPALKNQGKLLPAVEHRIELKYLLK